MQAGGKAGGRWCRQQAAGRLLFQGDSTQTPTERPLPNVVVACCWVCHRQQIDKTMGAEACCMRVTVGRSASRSGHWVALQPARPANAAGRPLPPPNGRAAVCCPVPPPPSSFALVPHNRGAARSAELQRWGGAAGKSGSWAGRALQRCCCNELPPLPPVPGAAAAGGMGAPSTHKHALRACATPPTRGCNGAGGSHPSATPYQVTLLRP